ncbi:unnamed protein product, partial [Gulo gulo]
MTSWARMRPLGGWLSGQRWGELACGTGQTRWPTPGGPLPSGT